MNQTVVLKVDGAVENPVELSYDDLARLPKGYQVADVSRFPAHAKRLGDGVELEALLEQVRPKPEANYLTLHADRDDFHVSVPLQAVRGEGILVYKNAGGPLAPEHGGPIRFLVRDPSACHTSEMDDCANVKYLSRIELSVRRGRDTRPVDDAAHAALHRQPGPGI
jgi:DMSO/TMAO reductase YedYZ molybdopterin-dependent catalytic subunit